MITRTIHYDATINFRLPSKMKNKFMQMCDEQNLHYQPVLRKLVEDYINTPIKDLEQKKYEEYLKTSRLL